MEDEMTDQQVADWLAWQETEPGMQERLHRRRLQLARLAALDAPYIILANQLRLIREVEEKLQCLTSPRWKVVLKRTGAALSVRLARLSASRARDSAGPPRENVSPGS